MKPEVVLSHCCRHLEIVYDVIISTWVARVGQKLVAWCGIPCWLLQYGGSNNRKKKFNMADVYFLKREVVTSQLLI